MSDFSETDQKTIENIADNFGDLSTKKREIINMTRSLKSKITGNEFDEKFSFSEVMPKKFILLAEIESTTKLQGINNDYPPYLHTYDTIYKRSDEELKMGKVRGYQRNIDISEIREDEVNNIWAMCQKSILDDEIDFIDKEEIPCENSDQFLDKRGFQSVTSARFG